MSGMFSDLEERALRDLSAARVSAMLIHPSVTSALWTHWDTQFDGGDTAATRQAVLTAVRRLRAARAAVGVAELVLERVLFWEGLSWVKPWTPSSILNVLMGLA